MKKDLNLRFKNKKASHIGFILSFVIFMTSILFLYTLLIPSLRTDIDKKVVVESLETELVKKISLDLTSLTVTVDPSSSSDTCLEFKNLINEAEINRKIIIQNDQGQIFTSYISSNGNDIYVDRTNADFNFFKISVSEEFSLVSTYTGTPITCTPLNKEASGYSIGSLRTEENIFQSKVEKTLVEYRANYASLKVELRVPAINEFGLGFVYENATVVKTLDPNLSISVYSERIPVRYIDKGGNKKSGDLDIRVW